MANNLPKFGRPLTSNTATDPAIEAALARGAQNTQGADKPPAVLEEDESLQDQFGTSLAEQLEPEFTNFYTCLPTRNFKVNRFQFKDGYIALTAEDNLEFLATMRRQPISEQSRIRVSNGPPVIGKTIGEMMTGVDSSVNRGIASDLA